MALCICHPFCRCTVLRGDSPAYCQETRNATHSSTIDQYTKSAVRYSAQCTHQLSRGLSQARAGMSISRACRKTPLRVMGCLLTSLLPLNGICFGGSACPDAFSPHLSARTRSRISLFRLQARRDRGPAISSVCHRRSLGLLNPYLSVFSVPMIPSVLPRSLRTV